MVLPPPNITSDLHVGHALTVTIQDTLVRWHRMCGKRVVWVPGCDRAGISTQMVVEKKIWAGQGLTRQQLGRQSFLEAAHAWRKQLSHRCTQIQCEHLSSALYLHHSLAVHVVHECSM
ncbi:valine--tRNA ligase, mitochondrial-like [Dermacentor albipictus]|uniref:valine--tRNA ligase, mitochondrial-like n=1 Tax=Dermacentor albipictus TaxID=60249 RepID=UPI0038FC8A1B